MVKRTVAGQSRASFIEYDRDGRNQNEAFHPARDLPAHDQYPQRNDLPSNDMSMQRVQSYIAGQWHPPDDGYQEIADATTGKIIAEAGSDKLDADAMLAFACKAGGPALRRMTFHERAQCLKQLALTLNEKKQALYDISFSTGATSADQKLDIDGGISTLFVYASKGRRELPDDHIYREGRVEQISKTGTFVGQHIYTPRHGVAVHINAFNFPIWGMLEKLAPAFLAGLPVIVKPATVTCHVAELAAKFMVASGHLPTGAFQFVTGRLSNTFEQLTGQDVVSFTGSADTALTLRSSPTLLANSVRFIAEQDSLNALIMGPDVGLRPPDFNRFLSEVRDEISSKTGQKCTAIRRILVPNQQVEQTIDELRRRLAVLRLGNPRNQKTQMGPLVSVHHRQAVLQNVAQIAQEADCVFGTQEEVSLLDADAAVGAFLLPRLFYCEHPDTADIIHRTEAFGPVATVIGYRDLDHALELANRGGGSLVTSVFTNDPEVARHTVQIAGAYNGRLYFRDQLVAEEATGHGSPLPHLVHGGPGRAGGGEELGGIRGVLNYMQRTAVQGSPTMLTAIANSWVSGAHERESATHPFTQTYDELAVADTLYTPSRLISIADIEHFAEFTGDRFYAHMDDAAAERNPFFSGRVAHGYLLLSFAAGLFVQPDEGPVLANTGLDKLNFLEPVYPGDHIKVRLTVKEKTPRNPDYGEIRWHVTVMNQHNRPVAEYELLTMNAHTPNIGK